MFEKYTEKARMAIFHARDETSKFGTPRIWERTTSARLVGGW